MIRQVALLVLIMLGMVSLSAQATQAAPLTGTAKVMQQVDQLLDRAMRDLNAAEELVDRKHMATADNKIDQVVRLVQEAERKLNSAQSMFRTAEAGKPTKAQVEQVERLITEARAQLREAESQLDRVAQRTMDHKLLRGLVMGADRKIDQAMKMLRQIRAGQ